MQKLWGFKNQDKKRSLKISLSLYLKYIFMTLCQLFFFRHCAKFFDLNPDQEDEIQSIQLSLNLNISQCYLKMEKWQQVFKIHFFES